MKRILACVCVLIGLSQIAQAQTQPTLQERKDAWAAVCVKANSYIQNAISWQELTHDMNQDNDIVVPTRADIAEIKGRVDECVALGTEWHATYYIRTIGQMIDGIEIPFESGWWGYIPYTYPGTPLQVVSPPALGSEEHTEWLRIYNIVIGQEFGEPEGAINLFDALDDLNMLLMMNLMSFSNIDGLVYQKYGNMLAQVASAQFMYQMMAASGMQPSEEMLVPSMQQIQDLNDTIDLAIPLGIICRNLVDERQEQMLNLNDLWFQLYMLFYKVQAINNQPQP